ncbi:hypothetical protein [Saccharibacillus sp. JS10]|uniref:hypothetical protein n=1 Tax=Saccharibacillus sp. JS10 TaxID=2950552 RepID=UPI0021092DEE|nr:hypothetical protein [Saccharibacillus sp. JS10]MCQ4085318.1 hypothetical protein [Saccharibacillus sp. JS10]
MNSFKEFISSHKTIPFKMCVIIYLGWAVISYMDYGQFMWLGAFFTMISAFIAFWLLLIIASALSFNKNKLPGIFTEDILIQEVRKYTSGLKIINEYPGVFEINTYADYRETANKYKPVSNPSALYHELLTLHRMLGALKTYKSEEQQRCITPFLKALSESLGERVTESRIQKYENFTDRTMLDLKKNETNKMVVPENSKFKFSYLAAIIAIIIAFGLFIYPGVYKYDKYEQQYPVKINRFTGHTEIMTSNGWYEIGDLEETETQTSPTN